MFTIGKLAKQARVNIDTIRFYERKGLMAIPPRTPGGYRIYTSRDLERLRFIRRAKQLGFSLEEIQELMGLATDPQNGGSGIVNQARMKLGDVKSRIEDLREMARALNQFIDTCEQSDDPDAACTLLNTLQNGTSG